ncbi:MAG: pyridoxamine 5'-phosphate oxidase family protein [Ferruginibacter sp.]
MTGYLSNEQVEELLRNSFIGRIGCTDGEKVYVVPVSFVYTGDYLVVHSREGLKLEMMRQHPRLCFEVERIRSAEDWQCVIIQGRFEELTSEEDKYYANRLLVEKQLKLRAPQHFRPPHIAENRNQQSHSTENQVITYRLVIDEKTGRYELPVTAP